MIELTEVIRELRRELVDAIVSASDERFHGRSWVWVTRGNCRARQQRPGKCQDTVLVIELGGDKAISKSSLHRVKLTMQPRIVGSEKTPWVSGNEVPGER